MQAKRNIPYAADRRAEGLTHHRRQSIRQVCAAVKSAPRKGSAKEIAAGKKAAKLKGQEQHKYVYRTNEGIQVTPSVIMRSLVTECRKLHLPLDKAGNAPSLMNFIGIYVRLCTTFVAQDTLRGGKLITGAYSCGLQQEDQLHCFCQHCRTQPSQ